MFNISDSDEMAKITFAYWNRTPIRVSFFFFYAYANVIKIVLLCVLHLYNNDVYICWSLFFSFPHYSFCVFWDKQSRFLVFLY